MISALHDLVWNAGQLNQLPRGLTIRIVAFRIIQLISQREIPVPDQSNCLLGAARVLNRLALNLKKDTQNLNDSMLSIDFIQNRLEKEKAKHLAATAAVSVAAGMTGMSRNGIIAIDPAIKRRLGQPLKKQQQKQQQLSTTATTAISGPSPSTTTTTTNDPDYQYDHEFDSSTVHFEQDPQRQQKQHHFDDYLFDFNNIDHQNELYNAVIDVEQRGADELGFLYNLGNQLQYQQQRQQQQQHPHPQNIENNLLLDQNGFNFLLNQSTGGSGSTTTTGTTPHRLNPLHPASNLFANDLLDGSSSINPGQELDELDRQGLMGLFGTDMNQSGSNSLQNLSNLANLTSNLSNTTGTSFQLSMTDGTSIDNIGGMTSFSGQIDPFDQYNTSGTFGQSFLQRSFGSNVVVVRDQHGARMSITGGSPMRGAGGMMGDEMDFGDFGKMGPGSGGQMGFDGFPMDISGLGGMDFDDLSSSSRHGSGLDTTIGSNLSKMNQIGQMPGETASMFTDLNDFLFNVVIADQKRSNIGQKGLNLQNQEGPLLTAQTQPLQTSQKGSKSGKSTLKPGQVQQIDGQSDDSGPKTKKPTQILSAKVSKSQSQGKKVQTSTSMVAKSRQTLVQTARAVNINDIDTHISLVVPVMDDKSQQDDNFEQQDQNDQNQQQNQNRSNFDTFDIYSDNSNINRSLLSSESSTIIVRDYHGGQKNENQNRNFQNLGQNLIKFDKFSHHNSFSNPVALQSPFKPPNVPRSIQLAESQFILGQNNGYNNNFGMDYDDFDIQSSPHTKLMNKNQENQRNLDNFDNFSTKFELSNDDNGLESLGSIGSLSSISHHHIDSLDSSNLSQNNEVEEEEEKKRNLKNQIEKNQNESQKINLSAPLHKQENFNFSFLSQNALYYSRGAQKVHKKLSNGLNFIDNNIPVTTNKASIVELYDILSKSHKKLIKFIILSKKIQNLYTETTIPLPTPNQHKNSFLSILKHELVQDKGIDIPMTTLVGIDQGRNNYNNQSFFSGIGGGGGAGSSYHHHHENNHYDDDFDNDFGNNMTNNSLNDDDSSGKLLNLTQISKRSRMSIKSTKSKKSLKNYQKKSKNNDDDYYYDGGSGDDDNENDNDDYGFDLETKIQSDFDEYLSNYHSTSNLTISSLSNAFQTYFDSEPINQPSLQLLMKERFEKGLYNQKNDKENNQEDDDNDDDGDGDNDNDIFFNNNNDENQSSSSSSISPLSSSIYHLTPSTISPFSTLFKDTFANLTSLQHLNSAQNTEIKPLFITKPIKKIQNISNTGILSSNTPLSLTQMAQNAQKSFPPSQPGTQYLQSIDIPSIEDYNDTLPPYSILLPHLDHKKTTNFNRSNQIFQQNDDNFSYIDTLLDTSTGQLSLFNAPIANPIHIPIMSTCIQPFHPSLIKNQEKIIQNENNFLSFLPTIFHELPFSDSYLNNCIISDIYINQQIKNNILHGQSIQNRLNFIQNQILLFHQSQQRLLKHTLPMPHLPKSLTPIVLDNINMNYNDQFALMHCLQTTILLETSTSKKNIEKNKKLLYFDFWTQQRMFLLSKPLPQQQEQQQNQQQQQFDQNGNEIDKKSHVIGETGPIFDSFGNIIPTNDPSHPLYNRFNRDNGLLGLGGDELGDLSSLSDTNFLGSDDFLTNQSLSMFLPDNFTTTTTTGTTTTTTGSFHHQMGQQIGPNFDNFQPFGGQIYDPNAPSTQHMSFNYDGDVHIDFTLGSSSGLNSDSSDMGINQGQFGQSRHSIDGAGGDDDDMLILLGRKNNNKVRDQNDQLLDLSIINNLDATILQDLGRFGMSTSPTSDKYGFNDEEIGDLNFYNQNDDQKMDDERSDDGVKKISKSEDRDRLSIELLSSQSGFLPEELTSLSDTWHGLDQWASQQDELISQHDDEDADVTSSSSTAAAASISASKSTPLSSRHRPAGMLHSYRETLKSLGVDSKHLLHLILELFSEKKNNNIEKVNIEKLKKNNKDEKKIQNFKDFIDSSSDDGRYESTQTQQQLDHSNPYSVGVIDSIKTTKHQNGQSNDENNTIIIELSEIIKKRFDFVQNFYQKYNKKTHLLTLKNIASSTFFLFLHLVKHGLIHAKQDKTYSTILVSMRPFTMVK